MMTPADAPLDAARLAQIRARAEAATPGPWTVGYGRSMSSKKPIHIKHPAGKVPVVATFTISVPDAAFIAAAREDVPALLASHAALEQRVRDLEAALAGAKEWCIQREAKASSDAARAAYSAVIALLLGIGLELERAALRGAGEGNR